MLIEQRVGTILIYVQMFVIIIIFQPVFELRTKGSLYKQLALYLERVMPF